MKRGMKRWLICLVVILGACAQAGWNESTRSQFVSACEDKLANFTFCKCWQLELEMAGVSPSDFKGPDESPEGTAAMIECRMYL